MTLVRRAVPADDRELIRLREVMLAAVDGFAPEPGPWRDRAALTLREELARPDARLVAFVVDKPRPPRGAGGVRGGRGRPQARLAGESRR